MLVGVTVVFAPDHQESVAHQRALSEPENAEPSADVFKQAEVT